jgi:hypothetical protein
LKGYLIFANARGSIANSARKLGCARPRIGLILRHDFVAACVKAAKLTVCATAKIPKTAHIALLIPTQTRTKPPVGTYGWVEFNVRQLPG